MGRSDAPSAAPTGTVSPNERPAQLFDDHADRLYRLARRISPSADDALDLVQDAFLRVARAPRAMPHGRSEEEAWLVRVLVNIRRDQWRKESVRRRRATHVDADTACPSPEGSCVRRITVWRALDALPVAILLDGRVAMAPTVRAPIGESAVITGQLAKAEARRIAEGVSTR